LDLYKVFAASVDLDRLAYSYLELATLSADRLQHQLNLVSPDLANALRAIGVGTDKAQMIAARWLRGETLPAGDFRSVGISRKVTNSDDAIRTLVALIHLFRDSAAATGKHHARLIWVIDEFQRIERLPRRVIEEINTGLHSVFNACPTGLTLLFSFSGRPSQTLPNWFSPELRDRIGPTRVLLLPPMQREEAVEFVREVLGHHRPDNLAPLADPLFPFSRGSTLAVIDRILEVEKELKPRSIMQAFNAVLLRADREMLQGDVASISADLARQVLKDYVAMSIDEGRP